jgi:hypothetical protein
MKYVLSGTVALVFHNDLSFIILHYTYVTLTSSPQFTSLQLTSLHFTAFVMISTTPSLHLIYHFSNNFPKIS